MQIWFEVYEPKNGEVRTSKNQWTPLRKIGYQETAEDDITWVDKDDISIWTMLLSANLDNYPISKILRMAVAAGVTPIVEQYFQDVLTEQKEIDNAINLAVFWGHLDVIDLFVKKFKLNLKTAEDTSIRLVERAIYELENDPYYMNTDREERLERYKKLLPVVQKYYK